MRKFTKYPSGYVKAGIQVHTNLDVDNMYAELDKRFSGISNKEFISDSIDLHLDYGFITRDEAEALRNKYLGN
jgi:hypothetical protein